MIFMYSMPIQLGYPLHKSTEKSHRENYVEKGSSFPLFWRNFPSFFCPWNCSSYCLNRSISLWLYSLSLPSMLSLFNFPSLWSRLFLSLFLLVFLLVCNDKKILEAGKATNWKIFSVREYIEKSNLFKFFILVIVLDFCT